MKVTVSNLLTVLFLLFSICSVCSFNRFPYWRWQIVNKGSITLSYRSARLKRMGVYEYKTFKFEINLVKFVRSRPASTTNFKLKNTCFPCVVKYIFSYWHIFIILLIILMLLFSYNTS